MNRDYYFVQEWSPKLRQKAEGLLAKIHGVVPELEVLFMGSAALGLPGENDIDLDILCDQKDIARYAHALTSVLGAPQEIKVTMAVWTYEDEGIEIDCILSDPKRSGSHVPRQKKTFEKLVASPDLREQYKQLKYAWNGLPQDQYKAKKKEFLNEVENS